MENKDYRKIFKDYYKIDFSKKYHIHHIDLNHNNNSIENLMILPDELHSRYHLLLNAINSKEKIYPTFSAKIKGSFSDENYNFKMISNLVETIKECDKWYDYKMYLDGLIPNIHGIKMEENYD